MLRTSCKLLIEQCHQYGLVDEERKENCYEYITREEVHVEVRNLTMMILLPRKLHMDDDTQAAFVRAAVSRVSEKQTFFIKDLDRQSNCDGATRSHISAAYLGVDNQRWMV